MVLTGPWVQEGIGRLKDHARPGLAGLASQTSGTHPSGWPEPATHIYESFGVGVGD